VSSFLSSRIRRHNLVDSYHVSTEPAASISTLTETSSSKTLLPNYTLSCTRRVSCWWRRKFILSPSTAHSQNTLTWHTMCL